MKHKKNIPFYDLVYYFPKLRGIEGAEEVISKIVPDYQLKLPLKGRKKWKEIFNDEFLSSGFTRFAVGILKAYAQKNTKTPTLETMDSEFKNAGCPTLSYNLITKNLRYPYRFLLAQADLVLPRSYPEIPE